MTELAETQEELHEDSRWGSISVQCLGLGVGSFFLFVAAGGWAKFPFLLLMVGSPVVGQVTSVIGLAKDTRKRYLSVVRALLHALAILFLCVGFFLPLRMF